MANKRKTKKFILLAMYVVAVLCLLLGLFLPFFSGKEMLATQLPDVFKSLLNKGTFALSHPVNLFGIDKVSFDIAALTVVLYLIVTALSLVAFVPAGLSIVKKGKLARTCYYTVEVLAIIVVSMFFMVASFAKLDCYSMMIAACGTAFALVVSCGVDKGKAAITKIALFLLSAVAFVAMLNVSDLIPSLADKLKLPLALAAGKSGKVFLNELFSLQIFKTISDFSLKEKALFVIAALTATVVVINFLIDTIKLATRREKTVVNLFDIARFGLELVFAVALLICAFVCKDKIGLMLIAILLIAAIQLLIAIIKFIVTIVQNKKRKKARTRIEDEVDEFMDEHMVGPLLLQDGNPSVPEESYEDQPVYEDQPSYEAAEDETYPADEYVEEPAQEEVAGEEIPAPVPVPDEDGYIDPALDEQYQQLVQEQQAAEADDYMDEDLENVELYEPGPDTTYLMSDNNAAIQSENVEEAEAPAEEVAEEAVEEAAEEVAEEAVEEAAEEAAQEPVEEEAEEPAAEEVAEEAVEEAAEEATQEPVEEVAEEPAAEEAAESVQESDDGLDEVAQNPFREVKPYNPYERHNNPFRGFEPPAQPYNPYRQQEPVQYEKVQPTRPAYEPKPQPKQYERPVERPVRPLRPNPIIQEFKPVPPLSEQPPKETHVYTIDTIYAGPVDDFIRKLSNDERIEFAKTFLEKNRGNLGSIPDYVVGGDNKKFFSATFIYLGRIRGMVSDGLLNKMYKEINLL